MKFAYHDRGIDYTVEFTPHKWKITKGQDIKDTLEANYGFRKKSDEIWKGCKDDKLVARIPALIYDLWLSAGIVEDEKEFKKALERNNYFKTTKKTL